MAYLVAMARLSLIVLHLLEDAVFIEAADLHLNLIAASEMLFIFVGTKVNIVLKLPDTMQVSSLICLCLQESYYTPCFKVV